MMQFTDLISRINNLINHDEVSAYFKSIRQDPLIWEGFQQLSADKGIFTRLVEQKTRLNPGTLALLSIDPEFDFSHLNNNPYSRELLEKIMFSYENYLQANKPVDSFEKAALLAAALIEKHKVTNRWKIIVVEICSRMRINTSKKLEQYWRTVFALVINLTDAKDELLFDLLDIQEPETGMGVFLHSVMCLPLVEEDLIEILKRNLVNQPGKIQALALKQLQTVTSRGVIKNLAMLLLEKYRNLDLHSEASRSYWDNPESSLNFALQCQAAADIAEFAGEKQMAIDLTNKSLEIISAIASIGKIKKSALLSESSDKTLEESEIRFSDQELNQQDIVDELAFTDTNFDSEAQPESSIYPVKVLKQSRKMARAGNPELADAELMRVLKEMSDDEIENLLVKGPRFSHSWDPVEVLNTLVDAKAYDEARRLADILLKQNPTSEPVNLAAAKASEGLGDFTRAEGHWELMKIMEPGSIDISRNLVVAYRKTGKINKAFESIKELVTSQDEVPIMDLISMAEIALELGNLEESEAVLLSVFETEPENPTALTLAGLVQNQKGEFDLALDLLRKATEISGDDPRAWMTMSNILARKGTLDEALDTLREGMAANPGNRDLRVEYAVRLMENGSVSEAFPLLRELSDSGIDLKVDTLLIDAMKQLGIKDLDCTLELILERHQNDTNLTAEFGQNLVWGGKREKGLKILQTVKSKANLKPDWATAYVEALMGSDYKVSISRQKLAPRDCSETFLLIDDVLKEQPANTQARLLKGELLLKNEQFNKAFNIFSELLDQNQNGNDHLVERINAGLAQSAAGLGKFEIALAAMQEAINLQPEWIGLKQLFAEILQQAGNANDAVKQAQNALELAPESIENVTWFANFMQSLGNKREAEKAMFNAIEKDPKNFRLHLLFAEQKMVDFDSNQLKNELEIVKGLTQNSDTPADLLKAAVLFEKNNDHDSALTCLSKAAGLGDLTSIINLAGTSREHGDLQHSLWILESINPANAFISLLRAEVEHARGNIEEAYQLIGNETVEIPQIEYDPVFLPASWNELFQSSSPEKSLRLTFDLKSGQHDGTMTLAREWVLDDPTNMEARVYGIEASLACGSYEDYIRFLGVNPGFDLNSFTTQFQFLKTENELDRGDSDAAVKLTEELIDIDADSVQAGISKTRALISSGNTAEADPQFVELMKNRATGEQVAYINKLGINRNLAKAAIGLNRWSEANELSKMLRTETNANEEIDFLALKSFVGEIEFHNLAQGLGIVAHEPLKFYGVENLKVDLDRLSSSLSGKRVNEVKRLVLHGNLAIEPSQENIRALAQISPRPEDAAAMMAGLRVLGQTGTAIQIARKFIDHPRVMSELALCIEDKDILKAIEILNKSVSMYPDQVLVYRLLSRMLEKNNQLEAAAAAIEKAIGLWADEPQWHIKAAEIWTALGSTDKPIEHLKYAEELCPDDTEIQFKLGKAYISTREPGYAIKHLEVAAKADSNRSEIWEEMSEAYLQAGDLDLALISSEKASLTDPFAVKPHLQAAKVNWNKGEIEKAIDQVKLAISLKQDDADSFVFLARLYKEQGDKLNALEALEKASHCTPVSVQTMIDHAQLLQEINGAAAARNLVESFSKRFPENPELLKLLAEAEVECGNLKQAEVTARRVLEMQPDQPSIHRFLGRIQEKSGNLDQAAHYFSQAIARNPGDTEGYLSLSKAFSKQREFGKAREVLEEGIHHTPEDVRLYLACAALLKDSKDYRGAEQILRKASMIDPRNINVHRQLGAVLALNLVHQSQEVSSHL